MKKTIILLFAAAALLCACGPKEPPVVAVASVSLSAPSLNLTEGDTQVLTATVSPSNATDASVTWSSSNTAVASVNAGTVTAVAPGSATITARAGDKQATCEVTVVAKVYPVESVSVAPTEKTLMVGETVTLTATVLPENATNKGVIWSTSDASVASVENGNVTALAEGTATITVTTSDGGKTAVCAITVQSTNPKAVDLGLSVKWADRNLGAVSAEGYGHSFAWGETTPKQTFGTGNYAWGMPNALTKYNASDARTVLEEADDAAHAILGDKWRMPTAAEIAEMKTNLTWSWTEKNGVKGYEIVSKADNTQKIFLPAVPISGNSGSVYWTSSRNDEIGEAWSCWFDQGTQAVTVFPRYYGHPIRPVYGDFVHVTGITLDQSTLTMTVGDEQTLVSTIAPENAFEQGVVWSSSDAAVASVVNGVVTALAAGTATITAKAADGDFTATCSVTVTATPPVSLYIYNAIGWNRVYLYGWLSETDVMAPMPGIEPAGTAVLSGKTFDRFDISSNWYLDKTFYFLLNDGQGNQTEQYYVSAGDVQPGDKYYFYLTLSSENKPALAVFDPGPEGAVFWQNFDDEDPLAGWTLIDADGDGRGWMLGSDKMDIGYGRNGSRDMLLSQSYDNDVGALNPDNWAFTPGVELTTGPHYISCWMCAQDASYPGEHYAIYVTDQAPGTEGWQGACVKLTEDTMTASVPDKPQISLKAQGNWYNRICTIPDIYAGKKIYVAFRHFACTDWFYLNLDEVAIIAGTPSMTTSAPAEAVPGIRRVHPQSRNPEIFRKK